VDKVYYDDKKLLEKPATKQVVALIWHTYTLYIPANLSSSSVHLKQKGD